jgi:hypothetical protein
VDGWVGGWMDGWIDRYRTQCLKVFVSPPFVHHTLWNYIQVW